MPCRQAARGSQRQPSDLAGSTASRASRSLDAGLADVGQGSFIALLVGAGAVNAGNGFLSLRWACQLTARYAKAPGPELRGESDRESLGCKGDA